MAKNSNLHAAKVAKNDEFYTMLTDIEKEMSYYKDFFKGKVVYCNCDDARESNFFKYFSKNFEFLGLKKLITTGYKAEGKGVVLIYEGDKNGNRKVEDSEIVVRQLEGSGDFRSEECIEFLKEADVVVTNPPFSLFREYVKQLMDYGKKFIILGNNNAVIDTCIFPYIKEDKLWLGVSSNATMEFKLPEHYEKWSRVENGVKYGKVPAISWFTNIENKNRNTPLDLYKRYSNEYPHYENYDAIEVSKVTDIPMDYDGVMGVPITFLSKYCPAQFEILGISGNKNLYGLMTKKYTGQECKDAYFAKFGKKGIYDLNATCAIYKNGLLEKTYGRIFIRKRTA